MDSFGKRLSNERNKLNLSIDEVSEKTKIRPHIIRAIEDEKVSILPAVYLKSFLKTYARFLNIPEEETDEALHELFKNTASADVEKAVKAYKDEKRTADKLKPLNAKKGDLTQRSRAYLVNYMIYTALGLAAVALLYFALFSDGSISTDSSEEVESAPDTTVIKDEDDNLLSWFEKPDSLILTAKAVDTAWIKIDIDNKISDQVLMVPGMEKRWSAKDFFILNIGNVGAVQFYRNGQLMPPFGKKGSVIRSLKITTDKVENTSRPWDNRESAGKKYKKPKKDLQTPKIEMSNPFKKKEKDNAEAEEDSGQSVN